MSSELISVMGVLVACKHKQSSSWSPGKESNLPVSLSYNSAERLKVCQVNTVRPRPQLFYTRRRQQNVHAETAFGEIDEASARERILDIAALRRLPPQERYPSPFSADGEVGGENSSTTPEPRSRIDCKD